jgi:Dynamin family
MAKNSTEFAVQIGKYIDSKDQKRGNKNDKSKSKDKNTDKSSGKKPKSSVPIGPALWPLISQVKVYCSAAALSSGVILVDLPGTGDANAARNSIAKQYMKNCDCVWILAPITRAVDDKTARGIISFWELAVPC